MRRIGGIAAALALLGVAPLAAQFGQNKVQYQAFDFRIIQTEHFELYYYPAERKAALDAARMAERWYARLSRILHHQFQGRKPIILYASSSDFQQTNTSGGEEVPEGVVAFTDPFKHRMVIPFTGSYADFEHVMGHEMVHQFQFDVYSRGRIGGVQTLVNVNPPLWFMEGMAEYLSLGPIDNHTAMWLRDASLEGHLPTLQQLTYEQVFPYYFGHAMWAFIGEKWGDEAIGQILQASVSGGGIEGSFKRTLGVTLDDLVSQWRDAVQTTYLPQLADHYRARRIAQPLLTQKRSDGTLHLAPALTPDGRQIAYFSEKNSFFVDLYLADAETGKVLRRLVKSTISSNYESLRFINSAGSFSPDGRYFAIAAKRKDRDDLVILDVKKDEEVRRIPLPLNGLTTPSWSPDGKQLVFTGYDGGVTDLFVVGADGTNLHRLTNDKYADLQPSWGPDGKTIAFATDRGPATNFDTLTFGNLRIALFHLDKGTIDVLGHMDQGKNINPAWAPDGRSLAFVSDRSGISNIFLYDFGDANIYQLTDMYTGVSGITPYSPCLSWAHEADRLAFAYYEEDEYNVYAVDNPRSLKRKPYQAPAVPPVTSLLAAERRALGGPTPVAAAAAPPADTGPRAGTSTYRSPAGFRASGTTPQTSDTGAAPAPVSVKNLIDSSPALPDTSEFTFKPYHTRYSPDNVARPTIGYERDNFGRGFFGGTAISLSDILGNHTLVFSGAVNGRLSEAQVLAAYINQAHRLNWAIGGSQQPLYFYVPSLIQPDSAPDTFIETQRIERFVIRDLFAQSVYPFSRFTRVEFGGHFSNISQALLQQRLYVSHDPVSGFNYVYGADPPETVSGPSISYYGPQLALVHDNSLFGWVGPFAGSRWRFEVSPTFGSWRFTEGLADWRRYFFARPFTLAVRGVFFGRFGRDAGLFPQFLGTTELIRGYTAGSLFNNECVTEPTSTTGQTGCAQFDQLIGSRLAVVNAELRFPLTRSLVLGFLPVGLPPIEGALFYDAGLAWDANSVIKWQRDANDSPETVRAPLRSWGGSIRMNFLGFVVLRFDYTKPLSRPHNNPYWTVSLGPTF